MIEVRRRLRVRNMNSEQRAAEIAEIRKLLDEVEAMAHYQIFKLERLRSLLAEIEERSKQVTAGQDGSEDVGDGGSL